MNTQEHRFGVSETNLVVRHLKLVTEMHDRVQSAIEEIDQLYGMDEVSFDEKKKVLNLAYDATRLDIEGIEALLKKHEVEISHDWLTRLREGHYRFVDQNIKDNANIEPLCCNKIPPGAGGKSK